MLDNRAVYTVDDAIADLTHITTRYSSDTRVQSSHIPNQPEEITMKLESGYVDKVNRRLQVWAARQQMHLDYLNWKIKTVKRCYSSLDDYHQFIFEVVFIRHLSYRKVSECYNSTAFISPHPAALYNHNIVSAKRECVEVVAAELENRQNLHKTDPANDEWIYVNQLMNESLEEI